MANPIQNPQLVRQTRLRYSVGSLQSGCAHQTIQAAITQALADGGVDVQIDVAGGYYPENLTITGLSSFTLQGGGGQNGTTTFIDGTITFTVVAGVDNFANFAGIGTSGNMTFNGTTVASLTVNMSGVSTLKISASATVGSGSLTLVQVVAFDATADAIVMGDNYNLNYYGGFLTVPRTARAVNLKQVSTIVGVAIRGRVQKANVATVVALGAPNLTMRNTSIRAQSQECLTLLSNEASVQDIVQGCSFQRETTSGPAIVLNESSGNLSRSGNSYIGLVTTPPVSVVAGTQQIGSQLEYYTTDVIVLTESTTASLNFLSGPRYRLNMTGSVAISVTNPPGSCSLLVELVQDATGARTPTFPASFRGTVANQIPVQSAANSVTILCLSFNETTGLYTVNSFLAGSSAATALLV
jgi:hypothetical protein